jgi:hypothetical protein
MLTRSAYADDRHLRSRMAIYRYAEVPADPGWRISPIAWDGTQVVADVGCGNGFDLRQLVPGGFTTETGAAVLATVFTDVTLRRHELPLAIPSAEPVVTYLDSIREPVLSYLGEPLDFDAVLGQVATHVEEIIRERGTFRAVSRSGVFVCR